MTSAYVGAILLDNPLHYWEAQQGAGVVAVPDISEDSGQTHAWAQFWRQAPPGQGASGVATGAFSYGLTGSIGLATGGRDQRTVQTPLSLELWFLPQLATNSADVVMLDIEAGSWYAKLGISSAGLAWGDLNGHRITGTVGSNNRFSHLVLNYDQVHVELIQDGVSWGTAAYSAHLSSSSVRVGIGDNVSSVGNSFAGWLASVVIYGAALTPTQINNHELAADTYNLIPVDQTGSANDSISGILDDVTLILAAVRTTYTT